MLQRLVRWLPAVSWMTVIFAMSSRRQFPQPPGLSTFALSIAAHLLLFGVLALLLLLALAGSKRPAGTVQIVAVVGAVLYGVSDELHQSFVPGRDASVLDVVVDTIGATIAVVFWTRLRSAVAAIFVRSAS